MLRPLSTPTPDQNLASPTGTHTLPMAKKLARGLYLELSDMKSMAWGCK